MDWQWSGSRHSCTGLIQQMIQYRYQTLRATTNVFWFLQVSISQGELLLTLTMGKFNIDDDDDDDDDDQKSLRGSSHHV